MPVDRSPLFPQADEPARYRVHVCRGPNCSLRDSKATFTCFEELVRETGLQDDVEIIATSCRDRCDWGPSVNVFPGRVCYAQVDCVAAREIVTEHLTHDRPVSRLRFDFSKPGRRR
ncbi:MAG: (2Fe-2S) ferredoxin domain-containing protein [Thermomicrobiales bacterium]|nr:(2Fe-2S) ferredoxin domain-containing protein [Thermomicrobiales bacterium]MCB1694322.1 (2Fe-2S) ferredoxin domain-containing protein [Pseudomonadales bacterium]